MQFVGVLLEVVEFVAVVVILDVFVRTRADAAEVAQGSDSRLAVGVGLAIEDRLQRAGVNALLWRELGEVAYRGIEVDEFAQRVTDAASGDIWSGDDQRYAQAGLVRGALGVQPWWPSSSPWSEEKMIYVLSSWPRFSSASRIWPIWSSMSSMAAQYWRRV